MNLEFTTWNAMIDIGFWSRLAKKKIEQYKLQATPQPLIAKFRLSNRPQKISILSIDAFSFDLKEEDVSGPVDYKVLGQFINVNTIEEFNKILQSDKDKQLLEKQICNFERMLNGEQVPHLYEMFLLIFADLKKHLFKYQFYSTANPVLKDSYRVKEVTPATDYLNGKSDNHKQIVSNHLKRLAKENVFPQITVLKDSQPSSFAEFVKDPKGDYLFCVIDSTNLPNKTGYHTSTLLAFFAWLLENKHVTHERLADLKILLVKEYLIHNLDKVYEFKTSQVLTIDASKISAGPYEERIRHKKGVQDLDLKSFMDERTLAKEAVDLNIKLMKWRLLPTLDIPKIQSTRCLLFGAGTLGCQLARNLIGWGVKNISFIDYSKVSYSNPVRQTLFEYEDTIKGGKPKAVTAAQKLQKIYPEINAKGYSISIPMPGHYVHTQEQIDETFKNLNLIQELVRQHDALFLLLDSREARWLPTVLANKYDKACITVGLGFDSFVIVRNGVPPQIFSPQKHTERLCCYFCNDIVTPQNTMKDRTLDQMCTVTKPGLSFISSAYAAQLYVSLLHHPDGHHAPAHQNPDKLPNTDLGKLPHHLRGSMGDFETSIYYGKAFDQCVACSGYILQAYNENRDQFMLNVLNDPSFIHQVTKLQQQLDSYENIEGGIIEIIDDDFEMMETGETKEESGKGQSSK